MANRRSTVFPPSGLFLILSLAIVAGCGGEAPSYDAVASSDGDMAQEERAMAEPPPSPAALSAVGYLGKAGAGNAGGDADPLPGPAAGSRKLVKTVELALRVEDTEGSAEEARAITEALGGFLAELSADRRGEVFRYSLVLRVPVERLDDAVSRIKALAVELDRESMRTDDVTRQFVDLESRLRTYRATEEELRNLLAESRRRDFDAEDVMAIYRQLTEIRAQIEQIQGQLEHLGDLAALSTIRLALEPTEGARPVVEEAWKPGDTVRRSFRALLEALRSLADAAIVFAVVVLPVLLILGLPLWWLVRRWRRRSPD